MISQIKNILEIQKKRVSWDEEGRKWTATSGADNFNWDASSLAWVSA